MSIEQLLLERIKRLNEAQKQRALLLLDNLLAEGSYNAQGLPTVRNPNPPKLGVAKGKYITSDDFDDPVDELFGL